MLCVPLTIFLYKYSKETKTFNSTLSLNILLIKYVTLLQNNYRRLFKGDSIQNRVTPLQNELQYELFLKNIPLLAEIDFVQKEL